MWINIQKPLETPAYHLLGFMQHSWISAEVRAQIKPGKNYRIVETHPDGTIFWDKIEKGSEILLHFWTIFSNYKHWFVVYEDWWDTPIFVYSGLIPDRVFQVMSKLQH